MKKIAGKTTNKKGKAAEQEPKKTAAAPVSPSEAQEPKPDEVTPQNMAGEIVSLAVINQTGNVDDREPFRVYDDYSENQGGTSEENVVSKEWARAVLKFPYDLISERTGKEYWKLTKAELDLMDEPAARIFSKWFSRYADSNPDAYMLAAALIIATTSRIGKMKAEQVEEQRRNAAGENGEVLVAVYD